MTPQALAADHVVRAGAETLSPGWLAWDDAGRLTNVAGGTPPQGVAHRTAPAGAAVVPGFVNAHAHLALGLATGVADDRPFLDWIHRGLLPEISARFADAAYFAEGARRSVAALARAGVTCVAENFLRADGVRALRAAGLRGVFFQEVFGAMSPDEDAYWSETAPALDRLSSDLDGFPFGYSPHTPWTCPRKTFARVAARARAEGRRLSFHLAESVEEQRMFAASAGSLYDSYARQGRLDRYAFGKTPTAYLADLGALGPATLVAHGVQLTADDVALLAASGAHVVHCPTSNLKLAEGVAPVAALLAAGVNVALGTDSAASNARLDPFEEMRTALLLGRGATRDVGPFTARTALRMATAAGARALGIERDVGDLAPGLYADFAVVDLGEARRAPARDVVDALVWTCGAEDVLETVVGGGIVHARGAS